MDRIHGKRTIFKYICHFGPPLIYGYPTVLATEARNSCFLIFLLREVKMICQHSQCGKKGGEGGREGETFVVV